MKNALLKPSHAKSSFILAIKSALPSAFSNSPISNLSISNLSMRLPRLPVILLIVYVPLFAIGFGAASAAFMIAGSPPFGGVKAGAWSFWPQSGTPQADPYMRLITKLREQSPFGQGEGLSLTAERDQSGRPLDVRCTYRVSGTLPAARLWTLSLYDLDGRVIRNALQRTNFTSAELVYYQPPQFEIMISHTVQSGNWLQMPPDGRVALRLNLYDVSSIGSLNQPDAQKVPLIERLSCA
jgi:hypothetical protein